MDLSKQEQSHLMKCLLDMGALLLDCGAEINRVEDTLGRMGRAYGADSFNAFVIPSFISISFHFPGHEAVSETLRIYSTGSTDFYRLEKLNAISRECSRTPLVLDELRERLDKIAAGEKPFSMAFWGSVLGGGGFAVFFGGNLWDGLVGAVFGAIICLLKRMIGRTELMTVASNLIVSFIIGLGVGLVSLLIPALHMDKILIGDIMLLIPGLTLTNGIRNTLLGNTISGVVRLAEALIWAGSLAGGFMISLMLVDLLR